MLTWLTGSINILLRLTRLGRQQAGHMVRDLVRLGIPYVRERLAAVRCLCAAANDRLHLSSGRQVQTRRWAAGNSAPGC